MREIALLPLAVAASLLAACDKRQPAEPQPQAEAQPAPREMGTVDVSHRGEQAPATPFLGPDGSAATLAAFRGKPLLVNLWATWCAPCVREMPTLDRLAVDRADEFAVIAVSQDIAGKRAVDPFFAKGGYKALKPYLDKENVLMLSYRSDTLPLTLFYDAKGRELWRVAGNMDWSGPRAAKLIDGALNPPGV